MLQPPISGRFKDARSAVLVRVIQHLEHNSASPGTRARVCPDVRPVQSGPYVRIAWLPVRYARFMFGFRVSRPARLPGTSGRQREWLALRHRCLTAGPAASVAGAS